MTGPDEISRRTGYPPDATLRGLHRLYRAGFIEAQVAWAEPPLVVRYLGITTDGLREAGMWPKRQLDAADLLSLVEELAERAPPEQRDRWEQVRAGLLAGGMGALGEFAAAIGMRATGLG